MEEQGIYGSCLDGHIQTGVCAGIDTETVVPTCCNENLCGRLYDKSGGKPPAHKVRVTPNRQEKV